MGLLLSKILEKHLPATAEYRPEIDGLRAIAVLLVVANHAKYTFFSGGHVGVDVFFVISGFLITRIIVTHVHEGSFSLADFFLRRVRRILPALLFVLLVSLPIAFWLMLPSEVVDHSRATIGSVFFVSNFILWKQGGYFDVGSDLRPLLHLWSLAIEEQFYLGFPLVVLLGIKLRRQFLSLMLWTMLLSSLILMFVLHVEMPRASFYLLPTRAWELLVGAVVAAISVRGRLVGALERLGSLPATVGLALVLCSAVVIDESTRYPGPASLIPVAGTALILAGNKMGTRLRSILTCKPLLVVGMASYSIYLWHQPLLVFGRLLSADYLGARERDVCVALTIFLGITTWLFVERPFRQQGNIGVRLLLATMSVVSAIVAFVALVGIRAAGFVERLPPNIEWEDAGGRPKDTCEPEKGNWIALGGVSLCQFGDLSAEQKIFLVGDSHADMLVPYLNELFLKQQIQGIRAVFEGCSEIPGSYIRTQIPESISECENAHERLYASIRDNAGATILAIRWNFRLFPVPGEIERLEARNSEGGHEVEEFREYVIADSAGIDTSAEKKTIAIHRLLNSLLESSRELIVIAPVPEIAWNIARINFTHYRARGEVLDQLSIPEADYDARSQFVNRVLRSYQDSVSTDKLQVIFPSDTFCNTFLANRCVAQWETKPFYLDDDHLSDDGVGLMLHSLKFANAGEK